MTQRLSLPLPIYQVVMEHAFREAPRECCGLLGGVAGAVRHCYPLTNRAATPTTRYFAAPEDLFPTMRTIREMDESLLAIYHSHPESAAFPSETDQELAFYPELVYLIVGPLRGDASELSSSWPEIRGFLLGEEQVKEVEVVIEGEIEERQQILRDLQALLGEGHSAAQVVEEPSPVEPQEVLPVPVAAEEVVEEHLPPPEEPLPVEPEEGLPVPVAAEEVVEEPPPVEPEEALPVPVAAEEVVEEPPPVEPEEALPVPVAAEEVVEEPLPVEPEEGLPVPVAAEEVIEEPLPVEPEEALPVPVATEEVIEEPLPVEPEEGLPVPVAAEEVVEEPLPVEPEDVLPVPVAAEEVIEEPLPVEPEESLPVPVAAEEVVEEPLPVEPEDVLPVPVAAEEVIEEPLPVEPEEPLPVPVAAEEVVEEPVPPPVEPSSPGLENIPLAGEVEPSALELKIPSPGEGSDDIPMAIGAVRQTVVEVRPTGPAVAEIEADAAVNGLERDKEEERGEDPDTEGTSSWAARLGRKIRSVITRVARWAFSGRGRQ